VKNQYFGDINDFAKYGLLRRVFRVHGLSLTVCWMLTAADGTSEGRLTGYLRSREQYAPFDPELFDVLAKALRSGSREIAAIERSCLLGEAAFHGSTLTDGVAQRHLYFRELWRLADGSDVVFFDPDNGIATESVRKGRRGSCKYLFWDELETTLGFGHSAIIYQHFPRVTRAPFVQAMLERIQAQLAVEAFAAYTSNVAFFGTPRPGHERALRDSFRDACVGSNGLLLFAA
jgi:hypothetical protein